MSCNQYLEGVKSNGDALQYIKEQIDELCLETVKVMVFHYNS